MKTLILASMLFFLPCILFAEDLYIAPTSTGGDTGADCADAHSATWFNTAGNWGSGAGKISAGDTVHLCGTFTGASNSTMLTAQASGSAGNVITILFESGAILTAPYWNSIHGALDISNRSYITVDGGTNGVITATANGTNLSYQQTSIGILASGCSHCMINNLIISNIYIHDSASNPNDVAVDVANTNAVKYLNSSNMTLNNVTVNDTGWALNGWGNNLTISNCNVSNIDHGVAIGPSGTITGINIYGNHFHNYVNWDNTSNGYHHDGIHMWGGLSSGGTATDRVNGGNIHNNLFDGDSGVNITAHVYLQEQIQNVNVFNNVIVVPSNRTNMGVWLAGGNNTSDTFVNGNGVNNALYNNYINDGSSTGGSAAYVTYQQNVSIINNILRGGQSSISIQNSTIAANGINNNVYAIMGNGNTFGYFGTNSETLSAWQSRLPSSSGQDSASWARAFANIYVNSNGQPANNSPTLGTGMNLTNLGITALSADKNGNPRPLSGAWDIGPLQMHSMNPPILR